MENGKINRETKFRGEGQQRYEIPRVRNERAELKYSKQVVYRRGRRVVGME